MEVSVNGELTVFAKRVWGVISQGDTSVDTTKTTTTTTTTTAYIGIRPRQFSVTKRTFLSFNRWHSKETLINNCTILIPVSKL